MKSYKIYPRVFREHRGGLAESLETTCIMQDLQSIVTYYASIFPKGYLKNIHISKDWIEDKRLPPEWNGGEYKVLADFDGYTNQCIGYTNFK